MVKTQSTADMLSSVDLFQNLSKRELTAIGRAGKEMNFAADKVVVEEGTAGGRFYLILEGKAAVSTHGKARQTLGAGDYFGEISLLDGGPRSASVVAVTPLKTFSLASFNFTPLLKEQPGLAVKMLQEMCRRLRAAEAVDE
ncbi:MAG TPA: cyclic nucleotide-binding domain-containing protein [Acidimicrobiales bacterium]|jgi:CRP-like cAMP-binding protein